MSKRDLFRLCKGKFKRVEDMEPALQTLVTMGYVREVDLSTGGRPTKNYSSILVTKRAKRTKWGHKSA